MYPTRDRHLPNIPLEAYASNQAPSSGEGGTRACGKPIVEVKALARDLSREHILSGLKR